MEAPSSPAADHQSDLEERRGNKELLTAAFRKERYGYQSPCEIGVAATLTAKPPDNAERRRRQRETETTTRGGSSQEQLLLAAFRKEYGYPASPPETCCVTASSGDDDDDNTTMLNPTSSSLLRREYNNIGTGSSSSDTGKKATHREDRSDVERQGKELLLAAFRKEYGYPSSPAQAGVVAGWTEPVEQQEEGVVVSPTQEEDNDEEHRRQREIEARGKELLAAFRREYGYPASPETCAATPATATCDPPCSKAGVDTLTTTKPRQQQEEEVVVSQAQDNDDDRRTQRDMEAKGKELLAAFRKEYGYPASPETCAIGTHRDDTTKIFKPLPPVQYGSIESGCSAIHEADQSDIERQGKELLAAFRKEYGYPSPSQVLTVTEPGQQEHRGGGVVSPTQEENTTELRQREMEAKGKELLAAFRKEYGYPASPEACATTATTGDKPTILKPPPSQYYNGIDTKPSSVPVLDHNKATTHEADQSDIERQGKELLAAFRKEYGYASQSDFGVATLTEPGQQEVVVVSSPQYNVEGRQREMEEKGKELLAAFRKEYGYPTSPETRVTTTGANTRILKPPPAQQYESMPTSAPARQEDDAQWKQREKEIRGKELLEAFRKEYGYPNPPEAALLSNQDSAVLIARQEHDFMPTSAPAQQEGDADQREREERCREQRAAYIREEYGCPSSPAKLAASAESLSVEGFAEQVVEKDKSRSAMECEDDSCGRSSPPPESSLIAENSNFAKITQAESQKDSVRHHSRKSNGKKSKRKKSKKRKKDNDKDRVSRLEECSSAIVTEEEKTSVFFM